MSRFGRGDSSQAVLHRRYSFTRFPAHFLLLASQHFLFPRMGGRPRLAVHAIHHVVHQPLVVGERGAEGGGDFQPGGRRRADFGGNLDQIPLPHFLRPRRNRAGVNSSEPASITAPDNLEIPVTA